MLRTTSAVLASASAAFPASPQAAGIEVSIEVPDPSPYIIATSEAICQSETSSMSTDAISEWHEVFSQLADRDDVRGAMGFFKGFLSTAIIHGVDIGTPSISLGEDEGEVEFSWSRRHGFVIAFADSDDFHWLSDVAGVQQRGNSIPGLLSYVRQLLDG